MKKLFFACSYFSRVRRIGQRSYGYGVLRQRGR